MLIGLAIRLELVKLLIDGSRYKMRVIDQNLRKKLSDWGLEVKRCNFVVVRRV